MTRSGTSVVIGGLDHWFQPGEELEKFVVHDLRLEQRLGVRELRLPPNFEKKRPRFIPVLRFPRWHFCPTCRRMHEETSWGQARVLCPQCCPPGTKAKRTAYMEQVPLVAMCPRGHLQDFPWQEWVHSDPTTTCNKPLRLSKSGGYGLVAQKVKCECGKERSLAGALTGDLSASVAKTKDDDDSERPSDRYACRGMRPWLGGYGEGEDCSEALQGSLRSSAICIFLL